MTTFNTKQSALSADIFGTTITITFANGQDLAVDVSKLSPDMQRMAMLHGVKQKLVDAAAIARNCESGHSATIEDKYHSVREVYDRITSPTNPTWNKERAAASTPTAGNNMLVRAIMQMRGGSKQTVEDFLSSKTKEQRAAIKRNPRVLAVIAELQGATVINGVNSDELLDELGENTEIVKTQPATEAPATATPKPRSRKAATVA